MLETAEELAALIAAARRSRLPLSGSKAPWANLTPFEAKAIADALYDQVDAAGSPFWKLGATDEPTQARLGLSSPIFAPLARDSVRVGITSLILDRSSFIRPKFEPEVGVMIERGRLLAMPCVEVADCRFEDWKLPPNGVIADGGLQGEMLFGPPSAPTEVITVDIYHDGELLASGTQTWSTAVERMDILPRNSGASHIATGAMTEMFDCSVGDWIFDFGPLGRICVAVVHTEQGL